MGKLVHRGVVNTGLDAFVTEELHEFLACTSVLQQDRKDVVRRERRDLGKWERYFSHLAQSFLIVLGGFGTPLIILRSSLSSCTRPSAARISSIR